MEGEKACSIIKCIPSNHPLSILIHSSIVSQIGSIRLRANIEHLFLFTVIFVFNSFVFFFIIRCLCSLYSSASSRCCDCIVDVAVVVV